MRKLSSIGLAIVVAVLLVACSSGDAAKLTGKLWQLTAITEKTPPFQGVIPADQQSHHTIVFNTGGTFNATADCNAVSGTYETKGSQLTITMGPATLVACPDGSFGDLFAHALAHAASYAIPGDELTITLKDGGTMSFVVGAAGPSPSAAPASEKPSASAKATATPTAKPTATPTAKPTATATAKPTTGPTTAPTTAPTKAPTPAPPPPATPAHTPPPSPGLTGKAWQLTSITLRTPNFQGVVPPEQQPNYTIEFKTDGTFAGRADCNQVAGTYTTTSAGGLTIAVGPSTTVACADGSLGDLYVIGLGNAAGYAITGGQLTITTEDQGTLVYK